MNKDTEPTTEPKLGVNSDQFEMVPVDPTTSYIEQLIQETPEGFYADRRWKSIEGVGQGYSLKDEMMRAFNSGRDYHHEEIERLREQNKQLMEAGSTIAQLIGGKELARINNVTSLEITKSLVRLKRVVQDLLAQTETT